MDRIEPIRPQPPSAQPIPALRRTARDDERPERDPGDQSGRRRRPAATPPPPDDGHPHVDVTV